METISSKHYSIKQIFKENWEAYLAKHRDSIPDYVPLVIEKMLSCRDPEKLGYHKFACPDHPDQYIVVPHSCKCRFCTTCGKVLTDKWVDKVEAAFPNASFHHISFTLPDSLRELLHKHKFLLNCLFKASSMTMLSWAKERHFLPACLCAIHNFGNDLKTNPHIHMLVSSGGISLKTKRLNKWKYCKSFPFKMLNKRWRFLLIDNLKKAIKKYLKENPEPNDLSVFSHPGALNAFFDPLLSIKWYVHDSEELPYEDFTVSYVGRYAKRPPISERRILHYGPIPGGEGIYVTFSYRPRRGVPPCNWTVPVEKFIGLLIKHILPPNFRQVRHYGALANRVKAKYLKAMNKLLKKTKKGIRFLSWRYRQKAFKGKDPLLCTVCSKKMQLAEAAFFSKRKGCLTYYYPP